MERLPSWAPAVAFTLLPNAGSLWGARIVKKELPTWYESLQKPSWRPPNWVFPPVWGALYSSMGYGSYLVWRELGGFNEHSLVPLGLYAGNLALNWSWVPIFFGKHKIGWRITGLWNSLPEEVVTAVSLDSFKKGLDKFMEEKGELGTWLFALQKPMDIWGLVTILLTTTAATATTTVWYHVNKTAAYLMYPYLAWLTFASVLNYRIWKDNSSKKRV